MNRDALAQQHFTGAGAATTSLRFLTRRSPLPTADKYGVAVILVNHVTTRGESNPTLIPALGEVFTFATSNSIVLERKNLESGATDTMGELLREFR